MESKYYICAHTGSCQYARTKGCAYGMPVLKDILDSLCGGNFRSQFTIFCEHPRINMGVLLLKTKYSRIEGNYRSIWTH
jgi:hypothetical protein